MSISLLQDKFIPNSSWNHSGQNFTFNSAVTSGSLIILIVNGPNATVTGVTGSGVTTWVREQHLTVPGKIMQEIWYGLNSSGASNTLTVTWNSYNSSLQEAEIIEVAGVQTAETVIDAITSATGGSVPANAGSITPTSGNDFFILGAGTCYYNTHFNSAPTGYTALTGFTSDVSFMPAYRIVTGASGSYGFSIPSTGHGGGGGYMDWCASVMAFKSAGGSPPANKGFFF